MIKFILIALICLSCSSNIVNEQMSANQYKTGDLKAFYTEGFYNGVNDLLHDIEQGRYGRASIPGEIPNPSIGLKPTEYAREKGYQEAHNILTCALIDGFIKHEKYLQKKGWSKK